MQISKSQIVKSFLFVLTLILCVLAINFLLVPYSSMMKRFRGFNTDKKNGNIDLIILGDSHEYDGLDAKTMSDLLGINCVRFVVQGGNPETSYYCLLDALKGNNIQTAVIGWDLLDNFKVPAYTYPSNRRAQMYREMLKDSFGNAPLFLSAAGGMLNQRYTLTFFEYSAFPENIREIKEVIDSRKLLKEPFYETEKTSTESIDVNDIHNPKYDLDEILNTNYVPETNPETVEWVKKIQSLCERHGISLYFICGPYPKEIQEFKPESKECYAQTKNLFENLGINFIDTENSQDFPDIHETSKYHDFYGHFTESGKQEYTKDVCKILKKR